MGQHDWLGSCTHQSGRSWDEATCKSESIRKPKDPTQMLVWTDATCHLSFSSILHVRASGPNEVSGKCTTYL
jgi:hypothetical protein